MDGSIEYQLSPLAFAEDLVQSGNSKGVCAFQDGDLAMKKTAQIFLTETPTEEPVEMKLSSTQPRLVQRTETQSQEHVDVARTQWGARFAVPEMETPVHFVPETETHTSLEPVDDARTQRRIQFAVPEMETPAQFVPETETHTSLEPVDDARAQRRIQFAVPEMETPVQFVPETETHTSLEPLDDARTQRRIQFAVPEMETPVQFVPETETHILLEPADVRAQPIRDSDAGMETLDQCVPVTETHTSLEPVDVRSEPMKGSKDTLDQSYHTASQYTETHTQFEPVGVRPQPSGAGVGSSEAEIAQGILGGGVMLSQAGDAAGDGQVPVTMVTEELSQKEDAYEIAAGGQSEDSRTHKHFQVLLQAVRDISGASADSSPETLAQILRDRWQAKETECRGLRDNNIAAHAQIKNLVAAASTICEATEDSSPEDAAELLRDARSCVHDWYTKSRAVWKERFRVMKRDLTRQIKTLTAPIKMITGVSGSSDSAKELAEHLRQTWDKIQHQNDELEIDLKDANDRVKQLEANLQTQTQEIKGLASTVGITLDEGSKFSDVVVKLDHSFNDLHREGASSRSAISAKKAEIEDLKSKMEALTTSLEEIRLLDSKQEKPRKKKLRLNWRKKTTKTSQDSKDQLKQLQEDAVKKNADISLLEAKMVALSDHVTRLEGAVASEKVRAENERKAGTEFKHRIDLIEFDVARKERLIRDLRNLVVVLQQISLEKKPEPPFPVKDPVEHAAISFMSTVKCPIIRTGDVLPFQGRGKAGDLQAMKVLGKGSYGKVFLGHYGPDGRPIAIKQPQPISSRHQSVNEMRRMKALALKESMVQQLVSGSPFFPRMIGMVTLGGVLCTVTSFIGKQKTGKAFPLYKSLTKFMPEPKLSLVSMIRICEDIGGGISELHRNGLLHNDIKLNNILLEKRPHRWHGVVIDFGLVSTIAYATEKNFSDCAKSEYRAGGGYYFLAPEVVLDGRRYSVASDIFSFGALLGIIAKRIKVEGLTRIAESCMRTDPRERPRSMEDVLKKLRVVRASC